MSYAITAVSDKSRQWGSEKGGPMTSYYVDMQGADGQVYLNVEWARKQTSPEPQVGQQVEGNLDQGPYGLKFRQAFSQGGGGGGGRSPEDRKSIVRQHSQEMALRTVDLGATWGIIAKPEDSKGFLSLIEWLTDHFVKDAGKP